MRLRLRPLRGQTYDSHWGSIKFIERMNLDLCKIIQNGEIRQVSIVGIRLPIIDTKDYEKIEDTKYKGD